MMPGRETKVIKAELEEICKHPLFANSIMYTRLLRYLVEKAVQQEDIKEYTIGADLFGKNYVSDKNDGTVRIYMYKLRKKLALYYEETNVQHQVFFQIEKGQYNLRFVTKKEYKQQNKPEVFQVPIKYLKIAAVVMVAVAVTIIGLNVIKNRVPLPWEAFLKKEAGNLLVVSDNYVLMHKNEYGERRATIYSEINSDEDFLAYKKKNPERKLETTDYTMLSKMAPFSTQLLTQWFMGYGSSFNLQLESELSLDDIKENNLVFVGQYTSMNVSGLFFLKNSKVFSKYKDGYKYNNNGEEKVYRTRHYPKGKVEFAMVSYGNVSPGKQSIYFVSNHDIGVMATLRNFTDEQWLREFYKQLPSKDCHFNALFRVSGIHRTDVSCQLVQLEVLGE